MYVESLIRSPFDRRNGSGFDRRLNVANMPIVRSLLNGDDDAEDQARDDVEDEMVDDTEHCPSPPNLAGQYYNTLPTCKMGEKLLTAGLPFCFPLIQSAIALRLFRHEVQPLSR